MRNKVIKEALEWYQTPYHHQAKLKHVGVDCAQLIAAVAENTGLVKEKINIQSYSVEWHLHNREEKMLEIIRSFGCEERNIDDREPGDILTFKFGRVNSHMGILVEETRFIHARIDIGKVVINELSGDWLKRLNKVFKFPNIGA